MLWCSQKWPSERGLRPKANKSFAKEIALSLRSLFLPRSLCSALQSFKDNNGGKPMRAGRANDLRRGVYVCARTLSINGKWTFSRAEEYGPRPLVPMYTRVLTYLIPPFVIASAHMYARIREQSREQSMCAGPLCFVMLMGAHCSRSSISIASLLLALLSLRGRIAIVDLFLRGKNEFLVRAPGGRPPSTC